MSLPFLKISLWANGILFAALGVVYFFWYLGGLEIKTLKASLKTANQRIENMQFNNDNNKEVLNDYKINTARLSADLSRLRQLKSECVPISKPAAGIDGSPQNELSSGHGIRSEWLYDHAGKAEREALKLQALQIWIKSARCE